MDAVTHCGFSMAACMGASTQMDERKECCLCALERRSDSLDGGGYDGSMADPDRLVRLRTEVA